MLLKKFIPNLKDIDKQVMKIMKIGLIISIFLSILSTLILSAYLTFFKSITVYYFGLMLLKLSILLATAFMIAGLSTDRIKKELH